MLKNFSRGQWVGMWIAMVVVLMAISVVAGAEVSVGAAELWLAAGVVPPVVMLFVWRGASPATVAGMQYAVNAASTDARR